MHASRFVHVERGGRGGRGEEGKLTTTHEPGSRFIDRPTTTPEVDELVSQAIQKKKQNN